MCGWSSPDCVTLPLGSCARSSQVLSSYSASGVPRSFPHVPRRFLLHHEPQRGAAHPRSRLRSHPRNHKIQTPHTNAQQPSRQPRLDLPRHQDKLGQRTAPKELNPFDKSIALFDSALQGSILWLIMGKKKQQKLYQLNHKKDNPAR